MKVELPCAYVGRMVPVSIGEGEANLDDFEQVNVASHSLIQIVGGCSKIPNGPSDDARKLCVLCCVLSAGCARRYN